MNTQIYIFVHNKKSYDFFVKNNPDYWDKCKFVWLSEKPNIPDNINLEKIIIPCKLGINIENYRTFLTFTGWYALSKNFALGSDFIGLFEYDVKFNTSPFVLQLPENTISGCFKRDFPDSMFIDKFPFLFKTVFLCVYEKLIQKQTFWAPTTNFIVPVEFLNSFVDWFYPKIDDLIQMPNHAHFMERAINIFAWSRKYKIEINENLIYHYGCNSHQINL